MRVRKEKEPKSCRNDFIYDIKEEFLNGSDNYNGYIGKKIKESNTDLIDLYEAYKMIKPTLSKVKTFTSPIGKVNYIIKTLEEQYNINKGDYK
jgi:hypothetical protein